MMEIDRGSASEAAVTRGATPILWQALESPATAAEFKWGMSQTNIMNHMPRDAEATHERTQTNTRRSGGGDP